MAEPKSSKPQKSFWTKYWIEISIVIFGLACVNFIFVFRAFRETFTVDQESAARLGSFIGGYFGSIFSLIGVVLIFSTLRNQKLATATQLFETKYFELIKMHRDNVSELRLPRASGRKVFVLLLRELRCILEVVREVAKLSGQELSQRQQMHIAYYCLFYGVGPNSSRVLQTSLPEYYQDLIDSIEAVLNQREIKLKYKVQRNFTYLPFEGHQSRLGHYYRHFYQMVRYVDQQALDIDKYEHAKTIRAQLSTHEQALLLINSLTPVGQDWWLNDLIVKYRLVQNIPLDFFDSETELDVSKLFKPDYFEWEDARNNGTQNVG